MALLWGDLSHYSERNSKRKPNHISIQSKKYKFPQFLSV
ncbi:hypothetical protein EAF56_05280 [Vibrio alginolyticus]|uniref:Uncharacterized protein n=1 Tax=Vibrio alginolyticus TaxID=663 RepID=A0AA36XPG6_VIBAL|nr:hypothetical protein AL545_20000 [Vibrio alginolyticus]NAW54708.1 hypothetical protein [Vibrio sp. V41_P2S12T139]NAW96118.1 hypothetical protein [Vibrio sp. V42_P2S4T144]EGQ9134218.1 hypothetical protein [Vibrio alginolyticus]EGR1295421.1 hypothetical protein [Vibrio alginolyticus]